MINWRVVGKTLYEMALLVLADWLDKLAKLSDVNYRIDIEGLE